MEPNLKLNMKTLINKIVVLKAIAFSLIFLSACNLESQEQQSSQESVIYQKVSPSSFQEKMSEEKGNFILVDVRTAGEHNAGAIEKSENHDLLNGDFENAMKQWDPETPIYVYCQKGGRSSKAAEILEQKGFKKIIELRGGYSAWK
jgi:rhodanese-related sulfurtransferase